MSSENFSVSDVDSKKTIVFRQPAGVTDYSSLKLNSSELKTIADVLESGGNLRGQEKRNQLNILSAGSSFTPSDLSEIVRMAYYNGPDLRTTYYGPYGRQEHPSDGPEVRIIRQTADRIAGYLGGWRQSIDLPPSIMVASDKPLLITENGVSAFYLKRGQVNVSQEWDDRSHGKRLFGPRINQYSTSDLEQLATRLKSGVKLMQLISVDPASSDAGRLGIHIPAEREVHLNSVQPITMKSLVVLTAAFAIEAEALEKSHLAAKNRSPQGDLLDTQRRLQVVSTIGEQFALHLSGYAQGWLTPKK